MVGGKVKSISKIDKHGENNGKDVFDGARYNYLTK